METDVDQSDQYWNHFSCCFYPSFNLLKKSLTIFLLYLQMLVHLVML